MTGEVAEAVRGFRDGAARPAPVFAYFEAGRGQQSMLRRWRGSGGDALCVEAAKEAVAGCMAEVRDLFFDPAGQEIVVQLNDAPALPLSLLSDGQRAAIGLLGEIAGLAAALNPQWGVGAPRRAAGVVLVDEIELHLHPKRHGRIVGDLRTAFPRIQFVVSTNSPFVVQSLKGGELIDLDADARPAPDEGRSLEDIAEYVMGVPLPQQSERRRRMLETAEEFYRTLDLARGASAEEIEAIHSRLDALAARFEDDPGFTSFLRLKREVAGLGA